MTVNINGLQRAQARLRAAPRLVERATRNAISGTVTSSQKKIISEINRAMGLKKKEIRARLKTKRPQRDDLTGIVRPTARYIYAKDIRHRYKLPNPNFPTRAYFEAKTRVGTFIKYAGFVNPRGAKRVPLIKTDAGIKLARAGTLRAIFQEIVGPSFERETATELGRQFREKLNKQLARARQGAR